MGLSEKEISQGNAGRLRKDWPEPKKLSPPKFKIDPRDERKFVWLSKLIKVFG